MVVGFLDKGRLLRYFVLPALAGLLASGAAYMYLRSEADLSVGTKAEETVPVVVAAQAVPARTMLTAEMVAVVDIPRSYVFKGSLSSVQDAEGKVTVVPLAEGEPITKGALASPENKVALAYHVPEGYRAVTMPVSEVTGVAGHLEIGDRVDIVASFPREVTGAAKSVLLLQDLSVLAVGERAQSDGGNEKSRSRTGYTSVTVAVKPADGVLLALAIEQGHLQAMLRSATGEGQEGRVEFTEDYFQR